MYFLQELTKFILGTIRNSALTLTAVLLRSIICKTQDPMWTKLLVKTSFCTTDGNKIWLRFQMRPERKTLTSGCASQTTISFHKENAPTETQGWTCSRGAGSKRQGFARQRGFPDAGLHRIKYHHLERRRGLK